MAYHRHHGLDVRIVRIFNTYGPQMRPDDGRAVSNFMVQALRGDPITIYGDGSQTRSFTYVDDEIRGFLALLDSDVTMPVNIGNPDEYTIKQLAEMTLEVTGSASTLSYRPAARRRPDAAPARHHPGPGVARMGADDRPARGPRPHRRVLPLGGVMAAGTSPVDGHGRRRRRGTGQRRGGGRRRCAPSSR